jgi:hypothetical protein
MVEMPPWKRRKEKTLATFLPGELLLLGGLNTHNQHTVREKRGRRRDKSVQI